MDVSIGVMAYNEEKNITFILEALLKQKTKHIQIREIVVISSGSVDKTNTIVEKIAKKNKKIILIKEKERKGKSDAINTFLKKAKSDILVLESADTVPNKETIECLCLPLMKKENGVVGGQPIPLKGQSALLNRIVRLQWQLHHRISEKKPKFGELIAFKKIMGEIPPTAADEEEIASIINKEGLKLIYEPKAIVYNKGPETIRDFLKQRRRVYAGHLDLKKRESHEASSMNWGNVLKVAFKDKTIRKDLPWLFYAIIFETIGRTLGFIDHCAKKNHCVWKIAESTKDLNETR